MNSFLSTSSGPSTNRQSNETESWDYENIKVDWTDIEVQIILRSKRICGMKEVGSDVAIQNMTCPYLRAASWWGMNSDKTRSGG